MKNEKYVSLLKYVDATPYHQIIMGILKIDVVDYLEPNFLSKKELIIERTAYVLEGH